MDVTYPDGAETAAARDAAGEPYAVVVGARAVLRVAWADAYCGVTVLGPDGRRTAELDLRLTPAGDLFLRSRREWTGGEGPAAPRRTVTWSLAGRREDLDEPGGDGGGSSRQWTDEPAPRLRRPAFGAWDEILTLAGVPGHHPHPPLSGGPGSGPASALPGAANSGSATPHAGAVESALPAVPAWRAPRPAGPRDLGRLFTAGAEGVFGGRHRGVVELVAAGELRLPTGRLVAADPETLSGEPPPAFTVAVAPGSYPVTVSRVRFAERPGRPRVAAARLQVGTEPVVRWAPALQDGQSVLDLGDGEFYGFGVDSGHASFADAAAWAALAARDADGRDRWEDDWIRLGDVVAEQQFAVVDGGAMVAWPSGWGDGSYPVWIGHAAGGEVVCFVADMSL